MLTTFVLYVKLALMNPGYVTSSIFKIDTELFTQEDGTIEPVSSFKAQQLFLKKNGINQRELTQLHPIPVGSRLHSHPADLAGGSMPCSGQVNMTGGAVLTTNNQLDTLPFGGLDNLNTEGGIGPGEVARLSPTPSLGQQATEVACSSQIQLDMGQLDSIGRQKDSIDIPGLQNIPQTEELSRIERGGNTAPQSSRKPPLQSARSSRRLFPDSARQVPGGRRMTSDSLQQRLRSGGLTLATSQSPMPGVGVIKEPLKKKRSFTTDQEQPRFPTEGLVTYSSASLSLRQIPNEVSDPSGHSHSQFQSERALRFESNHHHYGARSFGKPFFAAQGGVMQGAATDIPQFYFQESKLSGIRRENVTMPTDPHFGMSELKRNFETSSMPLPHEEPHSYITESDDARMSSNNFRGSHQSAFPFSEREYTQSSQEDNSRLDLQGEWRRFQERNRLSKRFQFQRKKAREISAVSSLSDDLTTAANIPQQTGEDEDTREVRSLVVHQHSQQPSGLLHRRVLSVLKEEDHLNQSPELSTVKKAEPMRHQAPPTPSDALDSVRLPDTVSRFDVSSPSNIRVAYLQKRQVHAHSAGLMRRTEDKFFARDESRHDLLPSPGFPKSRGLCSLPCTPQRMSRMGGVNPLVLDEALRQNLTRQLERESEHEGDRDAGGQLFCETADNVTKEERIRVENRYCTRCNLEQPLRSKHCRKCGFCVATYDHHCPWIGNCIGEKSRPIFFWYTCMQLTTLLLGFSLSLLGFQSSQDTASIACGVIALAVTGVFSLFVSSLVGMHGFFAMSNRTTCKLCLIHSGECLSRKKISYMKIWPRGSPFNVGCLKNLKLFCCYRLPRQHFLIWRYPRLTLKQK